jgi:hypothetical protein
LLSAPALKAGFSKFQTKIIVPTELKFAIFQLVIILPFLAGSLVKNRLNLKTAVAHQPGAGSRGAMGGMRSRKSRNACRVMIRIREDTVNCTAVFFSWAKNQVSA